MLMKAVVQLYRLDMCVGYRTTFNRSKSVVIMRLAVAGGYIADCYGANLSECRVRKKCVAVFS